MDGRQGAPRVLVVSSLYPASDNLVFGSFVAKQHESLSRLGVAHRLVVNREWRGGTLRGAVKYSSLLVRALAAATRRDYDVVLGHFLYPTAWIARTAARIGGVPYVVVAHGTDVTSLGRPGALARACVRATMGAACVVPVSRAMRSRLRDELGLPEGFPTEVINMGVDRAVFRPIDDARASFGWADDERIVLFAGNLIPRKAPEVLVDAFSRLRGRGAADRLVFAGDGELRGAVEAAAEAAGVSDAVTLTGALPPGRLAAAMSAADVFALPSLAEPLGLVLLEAMACGTPCVASRVGGIPEILTEGSGLLVPPGDAEALAAGIGRVLALGKDTYRQACLEAAADSDLDVNTARLVDVLRRAIVASEVRS